MKKLINEEQTVAMVCVKCGKEARRKKPSKKEQEQGKKDYLRGVACASCGSSWPSFQAMVDSVSKS